MTTVMVERDAVLAAVRGLIGAALEGRGGALFVVGEAGLGKTTVLEYAVAAARDRFKVGIGRADVAEAALPFGLISQALEALLGGPAEPAGPADRGAAPTPADYFYAVLGRLRRAAAEPLFLALDDAHWADPDSLTLLRLICRRIAAMPVAVLVTARPWPPEAVRAGEELATQQLAAVQQLAPLSPAAARSILSQRAGAPDPATGEVEQAAALCAGNPLLLDHVAAAMRAGQGLPEQHSPAGTSWARRLLLSHLAGLAEPVQQYLRAAAVLGRRFRPEVAPAQLVFDLGRALIAGGDHAAGVARYEELLAHADLPGDTRLAILAQLSQAWLYAGQTAEAEAAMEEAQLLAGPDRRDLAAGAMVDHAAQVMVTYGWKRAAPLAVRGRELAAEASAPVRAAAAAVWAVGTYFSGDPAGLDVAEAAARSAATAPSWRPTGTPWWDPVAQYASLALSAERFGDAQQLLDNILEAAERRSDPMAVAMALLYRARLRWRLGELDGALALSARLLEAADLVPVLTPVAAADRARVLLDLGRLDEAAEWCARVDTGRRGSLGYTVMLGYLPRGTVALRRGDLDSACATFSALWEIAEALDVRDPCTVPWAADAIAAYLACGREADAGRLIDWLAPPAQALPARWPKVVLAAGRAALAEHHDDPKTARYRYTEALDLQEEMPIPLARAQVLTDYGAFLHRQGDARQARPVLAEALRLAESCAAGWHAERARVEWRRAGGRTGTTPAGQLTPQEAAVARLAKAGRTNQEIAAQLYLTINTVETHLRHVYQKLGIHRRVDLPALPDAEVEAFSRPD